jgi:large subunit ribosomal protein L5
MVGKENPMREIKIEKITVNVGIGEPGERLENAKLILERLTKRKPCFRKTLKRSTFGVAKGRNIGVMVTVRGNETAEFLKRLIGAKEGKLKKESFAGRTFAFGIPEYLDIPKMEYDPKVGIIGMDVCVTLKRAGIKKGVKVGKNQAITSEEAQDFLKKNFKVELV